MERGLVLLAAVAASALPYPEDHSAEYEYDDRLGLMRGEQSLLPPAITYNKVMQPLEFWEKVKKKPKGRHTKASRLIKKMGGDFQPGWMSIDRPTPNDFRRTEQISLPEEQVARLMEQVTDLDIEAEILEMMGEVEGEERSPAVSRAVGAFQQWLVKKSSCPVQFTWRDLGEFFWPRYVRQGGCSAQGQPGPAATSCSWPRGMTCNPADAEVLQLLRWHCRRRKTPDLLGLTTRQRIRKSYKCRWIKIPYPVTSSCKCD
jgi:noggin